MKRLLESEFNFPARGTRKLNVVMMVVQSFVLSRQNADSQPESEQEVTMEALYPLIYGRSGGHEDAGASGSQATAISCGVGQGMPDSNGSTQQDNDSTTAEQNSRKRKRNTDLARTQGDSGPEAGKEAEDFRKKKASTKDSDRERWTGFIYIHPSCRGYWVKLGTVQRNNRRFASQCF